MNELQTTLNDYLNFCKIQKRLDSKTLKAYRIDLNQFSEHVFADSISSISTAVLETYISSLHMAYKPKTVKRKIASLKAFFHYLEYRDLVVLNPFNKIQVKFREPATLPKTIPLYTVELFLSAMYTQCKDAKTHCKKMYVLRDIAVIELLFSTGMRISELCSLKPSDIDLYDRTVLIFGKGSKERLIQIGNDDVKKVLSEYYDVFQSDILSTGWFFINRLHQRYSEQSVRSMIVKYLKLATIDMHITQHMFRHSFATLLLEADVDIRYIQKMLGHSSIKTTEIYTSVSMAKQNNILTTKHPRNFMKLDE